MPKNKYKCRERRRYLRLDEDCIVDYIRLTEDLRSAADIIENAHSKDISAGGILFIVKEYIPSGVMLELQIRIPKVEHLIVSIGKVVRCNRRLFGKYDIGVSFVWIRQNDMKLIDSYVKSKKIEELEKQIRLKK